MTILNFTNYGFAGFEGVFLAFAVILLTLLLVKIVNYVLLKFIKRSSKLIKVDATKYSFIGYLISAILYLLGFGVAISIIPSLKAFAVSLFAGAGILAVIIGFASQQAFSNIISGVFIVIFKPFRIGDRLNIAQVSGIVEDITLRHTIIRNFQNKRIIIPNSIISNETIENSTIDDEKICKWLDIGISYDSNLDKAKKIMYEEAIKHPNTLDNRSKEGKLNDDHIVSVRLINFGDSSVNLRAYIWCKNSAAAWALGCDLNESIKKRFDKENIEIPFPHRTLVFKDEKAKKINKKRKK